MNKMLGFQNVATLGATRNPDLFENINVHVGDLDGECTVAGDCLQLDEQCCWANSNSSQVNCGGDGYASCNANLLVDSITTLDDADVFEDGGFDSVRLQDIDMSDPDMVLVTRLRKDKKLQTARKSDLTEIAPLSQEAGELIRELAKQGTEGRVFKGAPEDAKNVGKQFKQLSKRLGFYKTGLTFHVLRHEACSRFHEQDLPEKLIMAYTGHRDVRSLQRYTHLRPSTKLNKWKAMLEA